MKSRRETQPMKWGKRGEKRSYRQQLQHLMCVFVGVCWFYGGGCVDSIFDYEISSTGFSVDDVIWRILF
jgi:hypothetical protein